VRGISIYNGIIFIFQGYFFNNSGTLSDYPLSIGNENFISEEILLPPPPPPSPRENAVFDLCKKKPPSLEAQVAAEAEAPTAAPAAAENLL
jgi:hypothetical protein